MAKMTALQAAIHVLESEGVEVVFGIPGAAILPFYEALQGAAASRTTWSATRRAARTPPRATAAPRPARSGSTSAPPARPAPT